MTNEARRAEIERMLKKSREAENRQKFWRKIPGMNSISWQAPVAVGVAIAAAIAYYCYYVE